MILHGPENIAGMAGLVAEGQRELGFDAVSICHFQPSFSFQADFRYGARGQTGGRAVRDTLMDLLTKVDRLHVYFGRSFLGDGLLDARLARWLNKRVFYTFLGCDTRNKHVRLAQPGLSMCSECNPHGCSANRVLASNVAQSGPERVMVSTPDLIDELPGAIYIPLPVRPFVAMPPHFSWASNQLNGPLRVLHAPTDSGKKGSRHVLAAIEALQRAHYPIELVQPKLVSQDKLFSIAATCHVAIDQVMAGVYGTFGAEMMMAGLPVIARIDPAYRGGYPEDLPVISAGPDQLEEVLKQICDGKIDLPKISSRGIAYALREHSHVEVARRISALY
jgi:hypothetical protein